MKRAPQQQDLRQYLFPWSPRFTISTRHAAQLLDTSVDTVQRMITEGTIEAEKNNQDKPNSPFRVNYDSVLELIERIHKENGLEKRF